MTKTEDKKVLKHPGISTVVKDNTVVEEDTDETMSLDITSLGLAFTEVPEKED